MMYSGTDTLVNPINPMLPTGFSVLIVDDDADFTVLLEQLIDEGFRGEFSVSTASDFDEGLRMLLSGAFSLAMVDYRLGASNGLQLAMRAMQAGCPTPIILLTTDINAQLDQTAISSGIAEFLDKGELDVRLLTRTIRHVIARRDYAAEVIQEKRKLEVALHTVSDGVVGIDANGGIEYMNAVAEGLLGVRFPDVRGRPVFDVVHLLDEISNADLSAQIAPTLRGNHKLKLGPQVLLQHADGDLYNVECVLSPLCDDQGEVRGRLLALRDVTELRQWSKKLMFQAAHDSLTGLVNRSEFESRLQQATLMCHDGKTTHVLCYVDLDQFKVVNDTCGHSAGDELLRQLSMLLQKAIRQRDTLARLGGDEFGILLWQCGIGAGRRVAEHVLRTVQDFRFSWGGKTFSVGASIGVVLVNSQCSSWAEALSMADSACYEAKESGRNRVHLVVSGDGNIARRYDEMQWVAKLVQAVEKNRLVLYRQTIADVLHPDSERLHYEILVRLRGEDNCLYPPGAFLPAAERYNTINMVDRWIVRNTLEWLAAHPDHLARLDLCAINLSGASVNQESMFDFIREVFEQTRVPPERICFEVTETVAISSLSKASQFIANLRDFGCSFALDDFGSGMSSFSYLKALPVDYLKIDGSFVRNIAQDSTDYAMVKAINEIGHVTGKRTIAEFCEDQAVFDCLKTIGVDYVQGYHVAKPEALS